MAGLHCAHARTRDLSRAGPLGRLLSPFYRFEGSVGGHHPKARLAGVKGFKSGTCQLCMGIFFLKDPNPQATTCQCMQALFLIKPKFKPEQAIECKSFSWEGQSLHPKHAIASKHFSWDAQNPKPLESIASKHFSWDAQNPKPKHAIF